MNYKERTTFANMYKYYQLYKPYKMLSQFVPIKSKRTLSNLEYEFAEGTNALGRLDDNTEGLLLLTNNKKVNLALMNPKNKHERNYWVQVHGIPTEDELNSLRNGLEIILHGETYKTLPCKAEIIPPPDNLPPRKHPVGTHFATTWIKLTLIEGKFHQIRKMTAAINHQTMRLIRVSIEGIELKEFVPEQIIELSEAEFFDKLKISLP